MLGDHLGRFGLDELDLFVDDIDHGVDCSRDQGLGGELQTIVLGGAEGDELDAPGLQRGQLFLLIRGQRPVDGLDGRAEADQHPRVDGVGLGQDSCGAGEVADLAWVDSNSGQTLVAEMPQGQAFVAAGGLEHDA